MEDPGWLPSLRGLAWPLIPFVGLMKLRRRTEANGLVALRTVFLSIVVALFLFLLSLSFLGRWDGGDERWVPWTVVALGICSLAGMSWVRRRPLVTGSPEALASSYRTRFFMGIGVAESAALFGFAGVFIGCSLWIYLIGLVFALVGLWMIAPSRLDIERRQTEITAAGSPLSLLDALIAVPPATP
jgi:F0F1-type ATP synthase membrane subunit c/vacuolar-type H+-ATPase subunit K